MEQKIICSIEGVGIYGVVSICIFVLFFVCAFLWVVTLKKNYLKHMEELPLDGSEKTSPAKNQLAKS